MRKAKKVEKSKNLHLGFYFALLVFFIIFISIIFKVLDTVKRSEFDGDNFFTIAVISEKSSDIVSVSPEDGELRILRIEGARDEKTLRQIGIPYDSLAKKQSESSLDAKSYFSKMLLRQEKIRSNLTSIDLVRLFIYAQKVDGAKIQEDSISQDEAQGPSAVSSEWFQDPQILREKVNIEITNTTNMQGLGNRFAKVISNMGGNVVLVNSSQESSKKSIIYYDEESYTLNKLSKLLDIPIEKKQMSSISDIIISVREDKVDF